VLLVIRIFDNAAELADIKIANNLQHFITIKIQSKYNQNTVKIQSDRLFNHDNYDSERLKATTQALMKLQAGLHKLSNTWAHRFEFKKVRHLIATACGCLFISPNIMWLQAPLIIPL
jgi:hypothetical protein